MNRTWIPALLGFLLIIGFTNVHAEEEHSINIRGGGIVHQDGSATVFRLEYEHSISEYISLAPSLAGLSYDYEDDGYEEEGDGLGLAFNMRFYPRRAYQKGFWFGPGVAILDYSWDWSEYGYSGSDSYLGIVTAFELGGKIKIGNRLYFDPSFAVGYHAAVNSEYDDREPQNSSVFATLSLGLSFQF